MKHKTGKREVVLMEECYKDCSRLVTPRKARESKSNGNPSFPLEPHNTQQFNFSFRKRGSKFLAQKKQPFYGQQSSRIQIVEKRKLSIHTMCPKLDETLLQVQHFRVSSAIEI